MLSNAKVIVITLNYDQNDYTLDCVESLLKSDYLNFEVLLIDNGSSKANYQDLLNRASKDGRLIIERLDDNVGYVCGINHGLKMADKLSCDFFLIMNNDTLIDEKAISALVDCAEKHHRNAIVSGKVYNYDGTNTLQYIGNKYHKGGILDFKAVVKNRREEDNGQYDQESEMAMLDDIYWIIPDKIFTEIGLYSLYFFLYGEQTDYALRALKKGFKLIFTPNAKLWHKGGITTDSGKKWLQSPKIEYWGISAVLKLSVLHFSKNESQKFYYKFIIKTLIKKLFLFLKGKIKFSILLANYLAIKHFRSWKTIRFHDNGYNPFNKK